MPSCVFYNTQEELFLGFGRNSLKPLPFPQCPVVASKTLLLRCFSPVEVEAPVAWCPPHRSQRAVFPHRALHVNSLSHVLSGLLPASENLSAADRNSVPSGKAYLVFSFPRSAVAVSGSV